MTRVNCVPVSELHSKHLIAEYREILRFRHAKCSPTTPLPASYRMGTGHVKFFYNKGLYLVKRHLQLREEMTKRGFTPTLTIDLSGWDDWRMNDWVPDEDAMRVNRERIETRLKEMGVFA